MQVLSREERPQSSQPIRTSRSALTRAGCGPRPTIRPASCFPGTRGARRCLRNVRQKRYSIADPMLRLWVRLHCRPEPPSEDLVAREVQQYALARLPLAAEPALVGARLDGDRKWGIIEID